VEGRGERDKGNEGERNRLPHRSDSVGLDVERRRDGAAVARTSIPLYIAARWLSFPPVARRATLHAATLSLRPAPRSFSRATDRSDVRPYVHPSVNLLLRPLRCCVLAIGQDVRAKGCRVVPTRVCERVCARAVSSNARSSSSRTRRCNRASLPRDDSENQRGESCRGNES